MTYDFDRIINRKNTNSYKWDQVERLFGHDDILPLWVADMDFESPPAVKQALLKRAEQGIYGYTIRTDAYVEAITGWFSRRHKWDIDPSWLTDLPGIVPALSLCVDLYSEPGSEVIVQAPVYYPFYDVIRMNNRKVAVNPLLIENGRYEMDYDHLEQLMKGGAKLLLLCNPHNPGGRVWERADLERLAALCIQYDVKVISDEIHCDLILCDHPHIPFASLSKEIADLTITCLAPTKTFNMPGLQSSFVAISNPELKRVFDQKVKTLSLHMMHFFNIDAVTAVYNEGEQWLDDLLVYLRGNIDFAIEYLQTHLPEVTPMRPEGSYLLWVDYRGLNIDVPAFKKLMYDEARVAFNEGSMFGPEGSGYLRINTACPRATLTEGLTRFVKAAKQLPR